MNPFSVRIDNKDNRSLVTISGDITEASEFLPHIGQTLPEVTIDLADVNRITSAGVREWMNFVQALTSNGRNVTLERCAVNIVNQCNLISSFTGGGVVRSVFAPYYCPKCEREDRVLIELKRGTPALLRETIPCSQCGQAMEFDDLPETYLSFHK